MSFILWIDLSLRRFRFCVNTAGVGQISIQDACLRNPRGRMQIATQLLTSTGVASKLCQAWGSRSESFAGKEGRLAGV